MDESFVPFGVLLRGGASTPIAAHREPSPPVDAAAEACAAVVEAARSLEAVDRDAARLRTEAIVASFALLQAAAAEAYERGVVVLLARLAREVLGRELLLAPADLSALAAEMLAQARGDEPVAVHVALGCAAACRVDVPVVEDPALAPGDLVLAVRDGAVDARLSVRLAALEDPA